MTPTDECGATAVEYALMVALVFLFVVTAVAALGVNLAALLGPAGTF